MNPFTAFDSLGTRSLQASSSIEQLRENQARKTYREAIVVGCLVAPVLLGLFITALPSASQK